eukprot:jgi/Undpi1/7278/HiC_scaffold_22.g09751.m1
MWDTFNARRSPAASFMLERSPFTFPDVAICASFLNGCLSNNVHCLEGAEISLTSLWGFTENEDEFDLSDYPDVAKVEDAYPNCVVMPLSKLTVNETGVNNGDITSFSASLFLAWDEDPYNEFNRTENITFTQYINAHFIDIQKDVEEIGETIVDVKLPYDRVLPTHEEWFTATRNHMVISLTEFSGITATGKRMERERTYSQTTTSGTNFWYWMGDSFQSQISVVQLDLLIKKFEYTTVNEVDPVNAWAIIGAIGGVWQFVVVAFGVFFIFSEKQPPDKKMRDFYETVIAPAANINKTLSSISTARSSKKDTEIDATDEDLPPGWVKRQRKSGSVYYYNVMTGSTRITTPHEAGEVVDGTRTITAPRPQNGICSLFPVRGKSSKSRSMSCVESWITASR